MNIKTLGSAVQGFFEIFATYEISRIVSGMLMSSKSERI